VTKAGRRSTTLCGPEPRGDLSKSAVREGEGLRRKGASKKGWVVFREKAEGERNIACEAGAKKGPGHRLLDGGYRHGKVKGGLRAKNKHLRHQRRLRTVHNKDETSTKNHNRRKKKRGGRRKGEKTLSVGEWTKTIERERGDLLEGLEQKRSQDHITPNRL